MRRCEKLKNRDVQRHTWPSIGTGVDREIIPPAVAIEDRPVSVKALSMDGFTTH